MMRVQYESIWVLPSNELGNILNETPSINVNTEAQRFRVFIFLCVFVSLCCFYNDSVSS